MVSSGPFSSNIDQIAREIKETNKRTAAGVRRAIRQTVAITAKATEDAIKAAAAAEGLKQAEAGTSLTVSFNLKGSGAVVRTSLKRARYARALELGSQGSGGTYDRHPVFARDVSGPLPQGQSRYVPTFGPLPKGRGHANQARVWVNQPTRPFFFHTAEDMEPVSEATLNGAVDVALIEAGWFGATRATAQRAVTAKRAAVQKAAHKRSIARRHAKEAAARQREFHRVFGTKEQKAAVRAYETAQVASAAARRKKHA